MAGGEVGDEVGDEANREVLAHEKMVWDALVGGSVEADAALLSDDFLGVYPSGFGDKEGHVGQLANGPTVVEYEIGEVIFRTLDSSVVLVAYRASYRRHDKARVEEMYVTSIWSKSGGRWTNIFSQDTPRTDIAVP